MVDDRTLSSEASQIWNAAVSGSFAACTSSKIVRRRGYAQVAVKATNKPLWR